MFGDSDSCKSEKKGAASQILPKHSARQDMHAGKAAFFLLPSGNARRMYLSPHRKLKSTIANTTRHPVWNESFQLLVSSYQDDVLTLILYDHDRVTADERLGRCHPHCFYIQLRPMSTSFTCIVVASYQDNSSSKCR